MTLRILLAAVVRAVGAAAPAAAHPTLLQAAPSPGVSLPSAPSSITLGFSEAPVARGSSVALHDSRGRLLRVGSAEVAGKTLSVVVTGALRPGVYDVRWSALGDDGHTTSGRFAFGVAGPR